MATPLVGIVMGSHTDRGVMACAWWALETLNVSHEKKVLSAHRTPDEMREYALSAERRGLRVIIGCAAHLPGMLAAYTHLPVIGVPVGGNVSGGMDALLSISQMPAGVPVATMPIGQAGATNAALYAAAILALTDPFVRQSLLAWREAEARKVLDTPLR